MKQSASTIFKTIGSKIASRSIWNIGSVMIAIILLFFVATYVYSIFLTQDLKETISLQESNSQLINKDILDLQSNNDHRKFQIATFLNEQKKTIQRYTIVQELIKTFERLQTQYNFQGLRIQDFQINTDKIVIKGSTKNLDIMYQSPSVLDTIQGLEFVHTIDIPYYKKFDTDFEFLIEAQLGK